ncbi:hypothetical protein [Methylocapsa acidiphila]|uniref:CIS tube protein n=1 Tax=Methylocapsa acidiphila TaxID=133552 RepID=UPI00040939A8|nr:hypothetical protein [Methylocapsa acidiphila]
MQRVLFLIEQTGERISALLNPERLEFTRRSGFRAASHATGAITGVGLSDDLVIATGGGATELTLDLLFDVDLTEASIGEGVGASAALDGFAVDSNGQGLGLQATEDIGRPVDVRELTRPFWNLSENSFAQGRRGAPPQVRFIWGRSWNVPGVIVAIAERFERFDEEGRPRRSLLRMRLRRVAELDVDTGKGVGTGLPSPSTSVTPFFEPPTAPSPELLEAADRIEISTDENGLPNLRLDQLAAEVYGDPSLWRYVAAFNGIEDPLHLTGGMAIAVPQIGGKAST